MTYDAKSDILRFSMMAKIYIAFSVGLVALLSGAWLSPHDLNHPFYIFAAYCILNMLIRGITYDFEHDRNAAMKANLTFGVLTILAGSVFTAGIMFSEGYIVPLGLGFAILFLFYGGLMVARGAAILRVKSWEKQVVSAALQRLTDENLKKLKEQNEQRQREEFLFSDLAESLIESGPSDK